MAGASAVRERSAPPACEGSGTTAVTGANREIPMAYQGGSSPRAGVEVAPDLSRPHIAGADPDLRGTRDGEAEFIRLQRKILPLFARVTKKGG